MTFRAAILIILSTAWAAQADTVLPAHTIRAKSVIGPGDIIVRDLDIAGAISEIGFVIGQEARVTLYAGRPIRPGDIGPPALIERNQIVSLVFHQGGLRIETEGRALGRAGAGEMLRVMNMASKNTITGRVLANGSVHVGP